MLHRYCQPQKNLIFILFVSNSLNFHLCNLEIQFTSTYFLFIYLKNYYYYTFLSFRFNLHLKIENLNHSNLFTIP